MGKVKKECDGCHAKINNIKFYKSWGLCSKCYQKAKNNLILPSNYPMDLEIAQQKVREVSSWFQNGKKLRKCKVALPMCYAGHKVKVIVVEDKPKPFVKTPPESQEGGKDEGLDEGEWEWIDDEKEDGEDEV
jgi:hypothetical protein